MSKKPSTRRAGAIYLEPDSLPVVVLAIFGALTVGGVSFLMSWDALRVVAEWSGIASGRTWGLPLAIDSSILVFSALWLIARRRGIGTWFHVLAVTLFTLGSVGGNVSHALATGTGHGWQVAVGAVAAAAFPLTVFATTHAVAGLLVDPDADVKPVRARATRRAAKAAATPAGSTVTATEPTVAVQPQQRLAPNGNGSVVTRDATVRSKRAYTDADRARALDLAAQGRSRQQIADTLQVPKSTVTSWVNADAGESIGADI